LKTAKKVTLYFLGLLFTIAVALALSVYLFKDRILQQFITEANKHINTPVNIGSMDVTLLEDFPNLSIVCREVVVDDSYPGESALFKAKTVSFQLNPWEVWKGTYTIHGLKIFESETNLKINSKGESNFNVVKKAVDGDESSSVGFLLKNVKLDNTVVFYTDQESQQEFEFISDRLHTTIETTGDVYLIAAKGDVSTEKFVVGKTALLSGKDFLVETTLRYFAGDEKLMLEPSTLQLGKAEFGVKGEYNWKSKNTIDLQAEGKNTDIQTLLSLLPSSATEALQKYQSTGEVYFNGALRGEISETKSPSISVSFGFADATITHPDYKATITQATLNGSFASPGINNTEDATLILNDISGELNNKLFTSKLIVRNFTDPEVILQFKGELEAQSLLSFYPMPELADVRGGLLADFSFEGKLTWLKEKGTAQRATATGSIELTDVGFVYGKQRVPVQRLSGVLTFNNNDLALSNLSGYLGSSDFVMNGFFKNIITFLLFEDQPIGIETDLQAKHIDLDELFAFGFGTEETNKEYEFSISPNIYLNFNCEVGQLNYKRFDARKVKGDLLVKNQVAVSRNLTFSAMNGSMTLNGIFDATNPKAIDVVSSFKLKDISADSIFYVFENFKQDFIQDKHLKGQTTADVTLEMTLDQHLQLFSETLIADINATIKKGELNNFEPLQALNKYLDDEGLAALRFAELKNEIHIENKTIYIPQMEIRSNVTVLQLSGTHTFDQQMNYRVVAPLRNKKKIDVEEAGSALEELNGKTKVFLKITGTTDDYSVQYDGEAVRKKIASDFKKEVQELKDAFKRKGDKKKKELEVTDEEFDWQ
jgi:hypothetical protein